MADASFIQTNFLGGEWSPEFQGRAEDPKYRSALNVCRNSFPIEEGAWQRRSGTRFAAPTRKGVQATLREFDFTESLPFDLELSAGHIRFFAGPNLVVEGTTGVLGISTASPAEVSTFLAHGWSTGDQVMFRLPDGVADPGVADILNRQFEITKVDNYRFTIVDAVDGMAVDGSTLTPGPNPLFVARVVDIATVYTAAQLDDIRLVQNEDVAILLHKDVKPYALASTAPAAAGMPATFTFSVAIFKDGPYLDPPTDGTTLTPSATSGTITLTASGITSINNGLGFQSTDVGRLVRLFSEPLDWSAVTAYAKGDSVKFNDTYWQALLANTGKQPDLDVNNWQISTTAAAWTWGTIATVVDTSHVTITLATADPTGEFAGGNLHYTNAIKSWRLGKYSNTTGWPSAGCYHENRFWLTNAANQFDANVTNGDVGGTINFCPTTPDGTVADNSGISEKIKTDTVNTIFWMMPDHTGIVLGTQGGEFLIQSSNLNEPITATSIKAPRITKFRCENIEPRRTGLSSIFVQRYGKKALEYVADVYSGKFSATNVSLPAKHLALTGIKEIAYVAETTPIVWARMTDGSLAGMTYKRESPFSTQPASFNGWHRHDLGSGRTVECVRAGPSVSGETDAVALITNDTDVNVRWVEFMAAQFESRGDIADGFFVDGGTVPTAAKVVGSTVVLYGLHYLIGKTVAVTAGGLDLGDHVVDANGRVTVTFTTDNALFTAAYLQTLTDSGSTFNGLGLTIINTAAGTGSDPSYNAITEYTPSGGTVTTSSVTGLADWNNNRFFHFGTTTGGIRSYNLTTGAQTGQVTAAALGVSGGFVLAPGILGADGNIYFVSDASNSDPLNKVSPSLTLTGTFGASSGSFGTGTGLAYPWSMCPILVGSAHFILSTSQAYLAFSNTAEVAVIATAGMTLSDTPVFIDENRGEACRGPSTSTTDGDFGAAFILGHNAVDGATSTSLGLYRYGIFIDKAGNQSQGLHKIGTISGTQIYAGWPYYSSVSSLGYDETDGNLLFFATISQAFAWSGGSPYVAGDWVKGSNGHAYVALSGTTGVDPTTDAGVHWADHGAITNETRLVKVRARDATVLWSTAVLAGGSDLNKCRIRNGRYDWMSGTASGGTYHLYRMNTLTGALVTPQIEITGVSVTGSQSCDGGTGQMVFYCDFTSGGGAPTGSSFSGKWATFGGTPPAAASNYYGPFTVGYTYTSQGQILRPLAPAETGAQNGPALGKTRRIHQHAALLQDTQGIYFGSDFSHLNVSPLYSAGGTVPLTPLQLKSGVVWTTVDDAYSFDGMLCWQITRPYPATVLSVESFLHTQDR